MASDFPDLHNIMSKKVAQLTKVIFHLNSRNDENDLTMQNVIACYENQMGEIVAAANGMIQKAQSANDSKDVVKELEKAYEDFRSRNESERYRAAQEFDKYKKSVDDKEKEMRGLTERKIATYEVEVNHMKGKLESLQKSLLALTENNEGQKNAHQKELGEYVKKQNDK